MAIPASGPISADTIATEFGGAVPHGLDEYYRGGPLVPNSPQNSAIPTSGAIAYSNFYGSSNRMLISLTATGSNYNVYDNRGASYQAGKSDITVTVPGTINGTTTGVYAFYVPNQFNAADTVTVVNNGLIQGCGGVGGAGGPSPTSPAAAVAGSPGAVGGAALYVNRPITLFNNGTIASGGGGGGGGGGSRVSSGPSKSPTITRRGGGGGGGGSGTPGGTGGAGGVAGTNGAAGGTGTSPAGGAGGPATAPAGAGGAGGGRGASGTNGTPSTAAGGAGAAAGACITGDPFITYGAVGTRNGPIA